MEPEQYVEVEQKAREVLVRFLIAARAGELQDFVRAELQPQKGDYARVFLPEVAAQLERAYTQLWSNPPTGGPGPDQTAMVVFAATTEDLQTGSPRAHQFPGGYQKVAQWLQPDLVWIRWKFVRPGAATGMAYDGLVWLGDRFAWFPKPWRAIDVSGEAPLDN